MLIHDLALKNLSKFGELANNRSQLMDMLKS